MSEHKDQIPSILHHNEKNQRTVELHKTESGCKKISILISTISTIIQNFQSTGNVTNLPGLKCFYMFLMQVKEDSLSYQRLSKDHSRRTAENSRVLGSESLQKKKINKFQHLYITTCCLGVFKKNPLFTLKILSCQTLLG